MKLKMSEIAKNQSIRPVLMYLGSKARLAPKIIHYFPRHHTFVDVFGGSAAMLLAKPKSNVEVFYDFDSELVNFYKIIRDSASLKKLLRMLEFTLASRAEFQLSKEPSSDCVESARRFLVRNRQSFGGLGQRWSYSVEDALSGSSSTVRRWRAGIERLQPLHQRLQKIQVENLDFRDILRRYDSPDTLFYLDPPYLKSTRVAGGYSHELSDQDHAQLVQILLRIRGKAVVSGYGHEIYKPLEAAGWRRVDFDVIAFSSVHRSKRVESIWIKPDAVELPKVPDQRTGPAQPPKDNAAVGRAAAARQTHKLRTDKTEELIVKTIETLRLEKQKVTFISVASLTHISRQHLSRRYRYLFKK